MAVKRDLRALKTKDPLDSNGNGLYVLYDGKKFLRNARKVRITIIAASHEEALKKFFNSEKGA